LTGNDQIAGFRLINVCNKSTREENLMYGRPMLGKQRMVTVATRVEPDELQQVKELARECGISVCAYLRDLVRLELARAQRVATLGNGARIAPQPADLMQ